MGLQLEPYECDKVLKLKNFLKFRGRASNLTASLEDEDLDVHVIEALQLAALARQLGQQGRWLDVGSGGGFPGLVLAAVLPELTFTLVEPRAKRASVLELGLAKLGRRDCGVCRGRIDAGRWISIGGDRLERSFDAASARAVFSPERWVEEGRPWLADGGVLYLHLRVGDLAPLGVDELGRIERGKWSLVGGRV
nr:RsmG family class I SAM-dependent methyltransferase [Pseudenhygromyxa sp. WMMC2535]